MATIPIIDISPALNGDAAERAAVAAAIDRACRSIGFLVIAGHGVDPALIGAMERVTRDFFDRPAAEKRRFVSPDPAVFRGYHALETNSLARSLDVKAAPPDLFERFSIGPVPADAADPYYRMPGARASFAANIWPDIEGFDVIWLSYFRAMEDLACRMMRLFALALDLEETWFDGKIDRHISTMVANHYPEQTTPPLPGQMRAGAHTDYGSLTILKTEPKPGGLEVRMADGTWFAAPVVPGTFIINIGDLMAQWTNDRWVSTLHRVVNPPREAAGGNRRLSIVFFHQPNYDTLIETLPGDQPTRYAPVTSGDHLHAKVMKQLTGA